MKIKYDVKLPEKHTFRGDQKSEEVAAIEEFVKGTKKNMCFEYDTPEEAKRRLGAIQAYRRKSPLGPLVDVYRDASSLFIVRLDPKTVKARKEAMLMSANK